VIAKVIDLLIAGILSIAGWPGVFAGAAYLAISDGFFTGQSVGKKLIGLRVLVTPPGGDNLRRCEFRESLIRNGGFAVLLILAQLPLLSVLFAPLALVIAAIELYFVWFDDAGVRIGDIFAGSRVTEAVPHEA
jgi:uncharacterized RDD family membrane protein YckC